MRELFLIVDVNLHLEEQEKLRALGFKLLFPQEMSRLLISSKIWERFDRNRTLLVLAGNGAARVGSSLPTNWMSQWQSIFVSAKRLWMPGQDPIAIAGRIHPSMLLGVKDLVILDDVISAGVTIQKIRKINTPWIPGANWHAAVWITQRAANVRGFFSAYATVELGERNKKVPLNSISTLIGEPEIASSYAQRNLTDPTEFLGLLSKLHDQKP